MSLAHFTLPTRELEKTARFFEATLGYARTPLPANSSPQTTGTHSNTITAVGRYTYHCNFHPGSMTGSVTVVH